MERIPLVTGLTQLQSGTGQLAQQAPLLTGGIARAASGGAALQQQGTAVLRQGADQLNSGLDALAAGSGSLQKRYEQPERQAARPDPTASAGCSRARRI